MKEECNAKRHLRLLEIDLSKGCRIFLICSSMRPCKEIPGNVNYSRSKGVGGRVAAIGSLIYGIECSFRLHKRIPTQATFYCVVWVFLLSGVNTALFRFSLNEENTEGAGRSYHRKVFTVVETL